MNRDSENGINGKKHVIYGAICVGFLFMFLNYTGILSVFCRDLYFILGPVMPVFEVFMMNIDEIFLILSGMENVYKAIISIAGTIVYGKKMVVHRRKIRDKDDISEIERNYCSVIKRMTEQYQV